MTVWIYQGKELQVFASAEAAQKWFEEHAPEGVAFIYEVEGKDALEPVPSIAPGCWSLDLKLSGRPEPSFCAPSL
jgi:hypothetical protein